MEHEHNKKGLTVVEIMDAVHAGQMGICTWVRTPLCPIRRAACPTDWLLEHLVVQDIFMTELSCRCYPTSVHLEKTAPSPTPIVSTCPTSRLNAWSARTGGSFKRSPTASAWNGTIRARRCFNEMNDEEVLDNIIWERLERKDAVTYPCDAEDQPGNDIIFGEGFPTETGRAKLVAAQLTPPTNCQTLSWS